MDKESHCSQRVTADRRLFAGLILLPFLPLQGQFRAAVAYDSRMALGITRRPALSIVTVMVSEMVFATSSCHLVGLQLRILRFAQSLPLQKLDELSAPRLYPGDLPASKRGSGKGYPDESAASLLRGFNLRL